jgi:hypothetical protein
MSRFRISSFQGEAAAKRRGEAPGIHAVTLIEDRCLSEFCTVAKRRWNGMDLRRVRGQGRRRATPLGSILPPACMKLVVPRLRTRSSLPPSLRMTAAAI